MKQLYLDRSARTMRRRSPAPCQTSLLGCKYTLVSPGSFRALRCSFCLQCCRGVAGFANSRSAMFGKKRYATTSAPRRENFQLIMGHSCSAISPQFEHENLPPEGSPDARLMCSCYIKIPRSLAVALPFLCYPHPT